MDTEILDIKKNTYTESRKRALKKYRENHREKLNEIALAWYKTQMETNADFVEKQREIGRRRYREKKQRELDNGVEPKKRGRPPKYNVEK